MSDGLSFNQAVVNKWRSVHGNESLDQQCQRYSGYYSSWVNQGNEKIVTYESAIAAYRASAVTKGNINSAPITAQVFWNIGTYGHVGVIVGTDLSNGRRLVAYASKKGELVHQFSNDVRIAYADSYDAEFLGWSAGNGSNIPLKFSAWNIGDSQPAGGTKYTLSSNEPGAPWWPEGDLMARIHRALKARGRYNGPDDGVGGENTAKGIQTTLNVSGRFGGVKQANGAQGKVDGKLGSGAAWGVQEYARDFGDYNGPQDGDPRDQSWTNFALGLERP